MKAVSIILLALLISGCTAPSRFAKDPRAAVVGPDYLDAIVDYPRDEDTQYYYPVFTANGVTNSVESQFSPPQSPAESRIDALLIDIPEPTAEGAKSTGKGWPALEKIGIPFSQAVNY